MVGVFRLGSSVGCGRLTVFFSGEYVIRGLIYFSARGASAQLRVETYLMLSARCSAITALLVEFVKLFVFDVSAMLPATYIPRV